MTPAPGHLEAMKELRADAWFLAAFPFTGTMIAARHNPCVQLATNLCASQAYHLATREGCYQRLFDGD